jgi:hypothetical protein
MFSKKYIIAILDEKWNYIKTLKLGYVPSKDDFIYFDDLDEYFKISNVIHQIGKENKIIITIAQFSFKK